MLLVAGFLLFWVGPDNTPPDTPKSTTPGTVNGAKNALPTATSTTAITRSIPGADPADAAQPSPRHPYQDTDVDGDVSVDSKGNFQPNLRAIGLFDYFFIESGRLSDGNIEAQIHDWLASRLTEPALSQSRAFLAQYLQLRQLAAQAYADGAMNVGPRERQQLIYQLQQQAYGTELAAQLFGEQYQRQAARLDYMQALAKGEHADPLQGLSPAETAAYQRTHAVLQAAEMNQSGASEEVLWQQRSDSYGYDAAYRMAELDAQRADWEQRVAAYQQAKKALLNDPELSEEQRAQQLAVLQARDFSASEQRRVAALEKIAAQQASTTANSQPGS